VTIRFLGLMGTEPPTEPTLKFDHILGIKAGQLPQRPRTASQLVRERTVAYEPVPTVSMLAPPEGADRSRSSRASRHPSMQRNDAWLIPRRDFAQRLLSKGLGELSQIR
jgi:hypothetical protein